MSVKPLFTIKYQSGLDDLFYVQGLLRKQMMQNSPWRFVFVGLYSLASLLIGIGFISTMQWFSSSFATNSYFLRYTLAFIALLIALPIILFLPGLEARFIKRCAHAQSVSWLKDIQVLLFHDHIFIQQSKVIENRYALNSVLRVEETTHFVLIFYDEYFALFIPNRAFISESQYQEFWQILTQQLPKDVHIKRLT